MSSLHRGTLKQCILAMAEYFKRYNYEYLSILFNPSGKYYTLLDDAALDKKGDTSSDNGMRLVCRLSLRELYSFTRHAQLNLFPEVHDAKNETNL
jgi:hypothetical protein